MLLLDEPFSGLDPVASDVMATMLQEQAAAGVPVLFSSHQLDLVERLCDHVTIIAAGRVVADGTIPQLREQRRTPRLRVDHGVVLDLADDADEQALLDLARAAGRVRAFGPVRPTLTELYREVSR